MRVILVLWFVPLVLFCGWYALSLFDIHFGWFFLTRDFHDHVFGLYGAILQVPPEEVPMLMVWLFLFDTLIVLVVAALRWHRKWLPQTLALLRDEPAKAAAPDSASPVSGENETMQPDEVMEASIGPVQPDEVMEAPIGPVQPAE